jgi:hypothetical protein
VSVVWTLEHTAFPRCFPSGFGQVGAVLLLGHLEQSEHFEGIRGSSVDEELGDDPTVFILLGAACEEVAGLEIEDDLQLLLRFVSACRVEAIVLPAVKSFESDASPDLNSERERNDRFDGVAVNCSSAQEGEELRLSFAGGLGLHWAS